MKQGELWLADLNPVKGQEQAGMRPVVIVSGNLLNEHLNVVICCPLTTKIKNYKGNIILPPDERNKLKAESEILVFHIRSVSKERLVKKIGVISQEAVQGIRQTLHEIMEY